MAWTVTFSRKAQKQAMGLPKAVIEMLRALVSDIEVCGPVRGDWPNYSKLGTHLHHCHLKKGRPTYVAVWEENREGLKLVEVTYAGTHERAPY